MSQQVEAQRTIRSGPRLVARIVTFVVGALTLLLCAGPATAATGTVTDANDRTGFDIRTVTVRNGDHLNVRVVHDGKIAIGQSYNFWFDTNADNPGPEYFFRFYPNSDAFQFRKVRGFADRGRGVSCGRMWSGSADIFRPRRDVLATVGSRCLGRPGKVKVAVQVAMNGRDDWAPGFHRFSGWVSRH